MSNDEGYVEIEINIPKLVLTMSVLAVLGATLVKSCYRQNEKPDINWIELQQLHNNQKMFLMNIYKVNLAKDILKSATLGWYSFTDISQIKIQHLKQLRNRCLKMKQI